jgi:two-component system, response regulator YesN
MKVLLADDSDLILERLEDLLHAYEQVKIIGSFKNGIDALKSLKLSAVDLAIIDLKMPCLTGLQVLKEIRKENKSLRFMILTLYSSDNYRQLAINSGADYFFSKIDDFEKISMVVEKMISEETDNIAPDIYGVKIN